SICANTVIARQQKPSRVGLKPAGRSPTRICGTATNPHQSVTAHQIQTFLTFLAFPAYEALSREPATSSKRGAGRPKPALGRSQIGRSSMTGEVSCQIFRLKHCRPRYAAGFFGRPVARV